MKPASTLQIVLRSYLVQSVNLNSVGVNPADLVIEPDVTAFELTEFSRTDELAAVAASDAVRSTVLDMAFAVDCNWPDAPNTVSTTGTTLCSN